jgi:hypothetical protein
VPLEGTLGLARIVYDMLKSPDGVIAELAPFAIVVPSIVTSYPVLLVKVYTVG